jgi:ABC-2 type transport system permease protein
LLQIIKKVFLNQIRNPRWLFFLVTFPIFLVALIGTILQGAYGNKQSLPNVQAVVLDESTGIADDVINAISTATTSVAKDYGIELSRIYSEEEGKREARLDRKVFVHADGDAIKVYFNEVDSINGERVAGVFQGVSNSVQVVEEVYDINSGLAETIRKENNATYELPMVKFKDENYMTSFDYYGVAELTLMMLYIAMIPLTDIFRDRDTKIKNRMNLAGISNLKYYTSSLIAYTLVAIVAYIPAFLFTIFAYDVGWGQYPVITYLYLMLFCIFNIILGMFLAVFLKQRGKIDILMAVVFIPVLSFLGGSYSPFTFEFKTVLQKITLLSPLRWVNLGIFRHLYNDDNSVLIASILLLTIISAAMFALINWKAGKDEKSI